MKTKEEVLSGTDSYSISLSKLMGKPVADVVGYVSSEFGRGNIFTFMMTKVVFDDGTYLYCEGEPDMPYLTDSSNLKFDKEQINALGK